VSSAAALAIRWYSVELPATSGSPSFAWQAIRSSRPLYNNDQALHRHNHHTSFISQERRPTLSCSCVCFLSFKVSSIALSCTTQQNSWAMQCKTFSPLHGTQRFAGMTWPCTHQCSTEERSLRQTSLPRFSRYVCLSKMRGYDCRLLTLQVSGTTNFQTGFGIKVTMAPFTAVHRHFQQGSDKQSSKQMSFLCPQPQM